MDDVKKMKSILSIPPVTTREISNDILLRYFRNTWDLSNKLYSSITYSGALYKNPDPLRHPLIFYLGHTAAFYVNKLKKSQIITKGINERYEDLFAQGVDPETTSCLDKHIAWPKEEDVWKYRERVFELVSEVIACNSTKAVTDKHPLWALLMAMEHDRIHFETSSVLIRQYPPEFLTKPEDWIYAPFATSDNLALKMLYVPIGEVQIGKQRGFPTFGWDNEYGRLIQNVPAFLASNHLISNEEFYKFVEEKGYSNQAYWSQEGWEWKETHKVVHPKFWADTRPTFEYRTLYENIKLPLSWPVEVNFHEAQAYCKWKGGKARLLTEAEFERLAQIFPCQNEPDTYHNSYYNLNLKYCSPRPVGSLPMGDSENEFSDVFGNVWQWLSNEFYPLPGFEVHSLYEDFSRPFFTPKHVMLKGGSWASTGTSASKYYRLWFRKNFYQHSGFRVAESI